MANRRRYLVPAPGRCDPSGAQVRESDRETRREKPIASGLTSAHTGIFASHITLGQLGECFVYFLMSTQVVIARRFSTIVVLIGSINSPPSEAVWLRSIASSTRKRSDPSGR